MNSGTLVLTGDIFSGVDCRAAGGSGVIDNIGALSVLSSVFTQGIAYDGGAVYKAGAATISYSTFTANFAAYVGGAIANEGGGTLTVNNSLFYDNSAGQLGPAIYNLSTMSPHTSDVFLDNNVERALIERGLETDQA